MSEHHAIGIAYDTLFDESRFVSEQALIVLDAVGS